MQCSDLLEAIWRGDIACAGDTDSSGAARLAEMLDAMLPMRRIGLQRGDRPGGQVLPEQTELMPALALGDVIEEELALEAPRGALVVILERSAVGPGAGDATRSRLVGRLVGELLIDAVQRGAFRIEQETDALYMLAQAYDSLARTARMQRAGLVSSAFRDGLTAVLASFWIGPAAPGSKQDMLLGGPLFVSNARLRAYLGALDASFSAPDPALAGPELVCFEGKARGHDDWLREIGARLEGLLRDTSNAEGATAGQD